MGEGEVILDKRPVKPRKKRAKNTAKRKYVTKAQKEEALQKEALEAESLKGAAAGSMPAPEPIEEAEASQSGAVTFFSKFKSDEILIVPARTVQLGTNKFYTLPAKVARFNNHKFTTEDPEVIDYIRNPQKVYEKFDRFGIEVFEVGVPEHAKRIHQLSDAGIAEYLMELHMGARRLAKSEGFSYESSV